MPIFAVYIVPPENDELYKFGSSFLGYDVRKKRKMRALCSGSFPLDWLGAAPTFGFHCTVGDALVFKEQDKAEIETRLSWICSRVQPFTLSHFHINNEFWAGASVIVSGFKEETGRLQDLAGLVATIINPLYIESPYYSSLIHFLPDYNESYYRKYGAPQVLEHYIPHFSFATGIPNKECREKLMKEVTEGFFIKNRNYALYVDELYLTVQNDDGFYDIVSSYRIGTGRRIEHGL